MVLGPQRLGVGIAAPLTGFAPGYRPETVVGTAFNVRNYLSISAGEFKPPGLLGCGVLLVPLWAYLVLGCPHRESNPGTFSAGRRY